MRVIRAALSGFVFFLTLAPISNRQAHAADVSLADLRVAARSLGFLQSGSRNSGLTIGVVYAPGVSESRLLAHQTAERLRALPGPGDTGLRADAVALNDVSNYSGRLDALFVLPGIMADTGVIMDTARRRRLLVMSNDPACLDQRACMLMVRDSGRAEIVLDSGLAQSAGVTFSSIFAMMVKRR
ncbi:MAG: hypothetical protein RJB58_836 [Pseudomonadota bacterium]